MLKKAKAKLEAGEAEAAKDLTQQVLNSSHQIWLAGLGAFSRAQQEGTKVFEALVKQGEQLSGQDEEGRDGDGGGRARRRNGEGKGDAADGGRNVGQAGTGVRGPRRARAFEARRLHAERRAAAGGAGRRARGGGEQAPQGARGRSARAAASAKGKKRAAKGAAGAAKARKAPAKPRG